MRRLFLLLAICFCIKAMAQNNPFTGTQFSQLFKKIYAEAPTGFKSLRGAKVVTEASGLIDTYKATSLLPDAISGQLHVPFIGDCKLNYGFRPVKVKADAEKKRTQLMAAVEKVLGKKLYVKESQSTIKQAVFYYKFYYTAPVTAANQASPQFETYILLDKNQYSLSLEIPGNCYEAPIKPPLEELDVNGKLQAMYNDAASNFATVRNNKIKSNQYYTNYDTKMSLFTKKGEVNDGTYNVVLRYSFDLTLFNNAAEAEKIYQQIKSGLQKVLAGKITFGAEEQSQYDKKSFAIQGLETGKGFLQSKLVIRLSVSRDDNSPGVFLHFDKTK